MRLLVFHSIYFVASKAGYVEYAAFNAPCTWGRNSALFLFNLFHLRSLSICFSFLSIVSVVSVLFWQKNQKNCFGSGLSKLRPWKKIFTPFCLSFYPGTLFLHRIDASPCTRLVFSFLVRAAIRIYRSASGMVLP